MNQFYSKPNLTAKLNLLTKVIVALFALLWGQTLLAQPTISSFTPTSGPIGTTVTITGTNFNSTPANNIVYFGDAKATVTAATNTSLSVTVPTGASYKPITVTSNGLTAYTSLPFMATFNAGGVSLSNSFHQRFDCITGYMPISSQIGDLDADGMPDLAFVNKTDGRLSILRNSGTNGMLSFDPKVEFIALRDPISLALGDLDGDGMLDVAVASYTDNSVSVFKNTSIGGTISLGPRLDYPAGSIPYCVSMADLDGDGKPDLAVANYGSSTVSVYKNTSTGGSISFAPKVDYATGSWPTSVSIGDLDGDGKLDLVTPNKLSNTVSILRNTSTGGSISFAAKADYAPGSNPGGLSIGDIDGDRKPDLVITNNTSNTVSLFRNTSSLGSIAFAPKADFVTVNGPGAISIADLDGDSSPDIAVASFNDSTVSVLKNTSTTGTISLAPKSDFKFQNFLYTVSIGDLDGNGKPDLAVSNSSSLYNSNAPAITVLRNLGNDPTITSFTPTLASTGTIVTITGTNFSGATGVSFGGTAAASFSVVNATTITALVGAGSTGFVRVTSPQGIAAASGFNYTEGLTVLPTAGPIGSVVTITGANFSITPQDNIVYFGAVRATVSASTPTSLTVTVPPGATYQPISVTTNGFTSYSVKSFTVIFPGSHSTFTAIPFAPQIDLVTGIKPESVSVGDFDGDGRPDLVTGNFGSNSVSVYKNTSAVGKISFAPKVDYATVGSTQRCAIGDLDGDGKLDLVIHNRASNTVSVFRNISTLGNIAFAPRVEFTTGSSPLEAAIGDLDGDGKPELITSNGQETSLSILRNTSLNGSISFDPKFDLALPATSSNLVALSDLDQDGKLDIISSKSLYSSEILVAKNSSTIGVFSFGTWKAYLSNASPMGVATGDLDLDGMQDIVAANQQGNSITLYRNTGTIGTAGTISFAPKVEISSYAPYMTSLCDLDGDGKPDIATPDFSFGMRIRKNTSTAGNISIITSNWPFTNAKLSGAISISPCDLDGDGKPEIIVANYNSSKLSIFRNTVGEAKLVPSGTNPVSGNISNRITIDSSVQTYFGNPYVQRHYDIEPANNPSTATATVTLYFTQQDFDNYNAHPAHGSNLPTGPNDTAGIVALRVYQYHGFSSSSVPGSYSGNAVEINPDDPKIIWNASAAWWEVTFDVNGFSGFFIGSVGSYLAGCSAVSGGTATITTSAFCTSGSATLSATGYTGTGVSYQWQLSNDNFVSDIHDLTGQMNPASAETGTITTTTYYRLKVACAQGTLIAYSNVVQLNKNVSPSISTQPLSQVACQGATATLTLTASGSNLTYQWRKEGVAINGATSSSFTINGVTAADAGNYDVVVSGTCSASIISNVAMLSVAPITWVGTTSSDWNTASNWCGGIPTATSNILIFTGATHPPVITGVASVNNLTIAVGATLSVTSSGTLNLYGNLVNNGTMDASKGSIAFRGTAGQTIPAITAANVLMNNAGGVTLTGNMIVGSMLTLTAGKITLGVNNMTTSALTIENPNSYIITNGSGSLTITKVGSSDAIFPVGSGHGLFNPIVIQNGSGRDFSVRVSSGITPSIQKPSNAINCTWNIVPAVASSTPATIKFGYKDEDANASADPVASMEVGVHDGSKWRVISPSDGVRPVGAAGARSVTATTPMFGNFVLGNLNVVTSVSTVNPDVTSVIMMPNIITDKAVINVSVKQAMKVNWTITDMNGRIVMKFTKSVNAGQNNITLNLASLSQGTYFLTGNTTKGSLPVVTLVKQ